MKCHHLLSLIGLLIANTTLAATPVDLSDHPLSYLEKKLSSSTEQTQLHKAQTHIDSNQIVHTRIQQAYAGLPVWNASAVIHTPLTHIQNADHTHTTMTGIIYEDLEKDLKTSPSSTLTEAQKTKALEQIKLAHAKKTGAHLSEETIKPIVYIDDKKKAHYAYLISFLMNDPKNPRKKSTLIVDATSLLAYQNWNEAILS